MLYYGCSLHYIYIYICIYSNWNNDIAVMQHLLYFVRIIGPYHLLISTFSSHASLYSLCPIGCNCLSVIIFGIMEPTVWLLADAQSHVSNDESTAGSGIRPYFEPIKLPTPILAKTQSPEPVTPHLTVRHAVHFAPHRNISYGKSFIYIK
jgi:hypothetical protein